MGELVSIYELQMRKGYEEMESVKLCSNDYAYFVSGRRKIIDPSRIRRDMIKGYMTMLSNVNK